MKDKFDFRIIFYCAVLLLGIGLVIALIIFYIYAMIKYGSTPISECPLWVVWLLHGGK